MKETTNNVNINWVLENLFNIQREVLLLLVRCQIFSMYKLRKLLLGLFALIKVFQAKHLYVLMKVPKTQLFLYVTMNLVIVTIARAN